jgi:hypothetical protein
LSYTVNGKSPREVPIEHYLLLKKKYDEKLYIQLKKNPKKSLFDKISEAIGAGIFSNVKEQRKQLASYEYRKTTDQLTDSNIASYNEIVAILNAQYDILDLMKRQLVIFAELSDFIIDSDFVEDKEPKRVHGTGVIDYPHISKATFRLNKKEALMLIYVMEKANLLEFENETSRNKFIENNFNYTENRQSQLQKTILAMKDVNSDFSNLKAYYQSATNTRSLERLRKKINTTLSNFIFESKPQK